jgi:hypothetical protein
VGIRVNAEHTVKFKPIPVAAPVDVEPPEVPDLDGDGGANGETSLLEIGLRLWIRLPGHGMRAGSSGRPDCVGHFRAAPAERLWFANRAFAGGLVFGFGIQLGPDQNDDHREPDPLARAGRNRPRPMAFMRVVAGDR